jgi:hypothetical protein
MQATVHDSLHHFDLKEGYYVNYQRISAEMIEAPARVGTYDFDRQALFCAMIMLLL